MRPNESDENPLFLKVQFHHQPVSITFDIKDNPSIFKYTCTGIGLFYLIGRFPAWIHGSIKPGL